MVNRVKLKKRHVKHPQNMAKDSRPSGEGGAHGPVADILVEIVSEMEDQRIILNKMEEQRIILDDLGQRFRQNLSSIRQKVALVTKTAPRDELVGSLREIRDGSPSFSLDTAHFSD